MLISKFGIIDADEKISAYEKSIGAKLPSQLTSFIRKYNGGETPNTKFRCANISSDVRAFFGLGDVKYSLDDIKPVQRGEIKYLPFALDSFGNNFVVNLQSGEVAFFDHESGEISPLLDDLKSFINICESKPLKPVKSVEEREKELTERGLGSVITGELRNMWKAEIDKYSSMKLQIVQI